MLLSIFFEEQILGLIDQSFVDCFKMSLQHAAGLEGFLTDEALMVSLVQVDKVDVLL